jgi:hypothetical protein
MLNKYFLAIILIFVLGTLLVGLAGCEGASKLDAEVRDKMEAKIAEWNENGFPVADPSLVEQTKGNLLEWRFKYAKLYLIFNSQKAHPVTSRYVLEAVAMDWYHTYPANIKPRFTLEVRAFHDMESHDNEWGFCKIKRGGNPEVHWYKTDVI